MMTKEQREAIKERLATIEAAHGGRLTPADVVEDAKNLESPLHYCFTWDVDKAAYQHWLDQARTLITSVQVVQRTDKTTVETVYYVRDPSAADSVQGYVSITALRQDKELARAAIVAEFSRVASLLRRARELAAVLNVQDDVEALLTSVVGLRTRVMEQPSQQQ